MNYLKDNVSANCAEKITQDLIKLRDELIAEERSKNLNVAIELMDYLHPLLTEEQIEVVLEMLKKFLR